VEPFPRGADPLRGCPERVSQGRGASVEPFPISQHLRIKVRDGPPVAAITQLLVRVVAHELVQEVD